MDPVTAGLLISAGGLAWTVAKDVGLVDYALGFLKSKPSRGGGGGRRVGGILKYKYNIKKNLNKNIIKATLFNDNSKNIA